MSAPVLSSGDGPRLLSFDGGGIRSISQALMVREMMHRIEMDHQLSNPPKVSEYFDMICGSGLGGLLAVMCGVLHMTGDQLVEEFVGLCKVLFSNGLDAMQRTILLEQEIGGLMAVYCSGREERKMVCKDETCKTLTMRDIHDSFEPINLVQTLAPIARSAKRFVPPLRYTTSSNQLVIHDKHLSETFVGGELRWNNPTDELTKGGCSRVQRPTRRVRHCERVSNDMKRRFGNAPDVFWRLSVEQGLQNLAVDLSNLDALVSHTYSYLHNAHTHQDIDSLIVDLVRRPERILAKMISGEILNAPKLLGPRICPPPTQYFTGRKDSLEQLEGHFNSSGGECHIAVLYGMGGSGKTQIGLEFIQQNKFRFSSVYFIDASSKLTLENDLASIAVGSSDQPSVDDALRILRSRQEEWLLFFDNADDPSLNLRPYISWSHGNILITSRNRELRVHAPKCSIWVDRLDLKDAKELLLKGLSIGENSEEHGIAICIVQELGCLALAITQARAFLAKGLCSLNEYLPLYLQNRKKLLEHDSAQKTDDYQYSVYTTWAISFNKLSPNAALLLELLSFMHHEAIPSRIFEDAWEVYDSQHEDAVPPILLNLLSSFTAGDLTWDIFRFRTLVGELLSFSLLEFDQAQLTFSLHPLDNTCATQTLLSLAAPSGNSILANMRRKSLLPHLRESVVMGIMQHYTLLSRMGTAFLYGGLLQQSLGVYEQELTEMQLVLGPNHPDTLGCMNNLANTYSDLGQLDNALELTERVLKLRIQFLGEGHPDSLASMNNLATTYSALGQHHDTLQLRERVLELMTHILGEGHPDSLASMNNLAGIYSDLGQHRHALQLIERVLELRTQILGEEHPNTLASMSNLAITYSALGQHRNAFELNEQVLKLMTHILGVEHLDTLTCMNNLAGRYLDLGQHRMVLQLMGRVLELRTRILGEEHPDTLTSMNSLAIIYSGLGKYHNALELYKQVLEARRRILGEEHPDTGYSSNEVERDVLG
ncbi:hypothetical protein DL96DRAFT_1819944 [Flagelloscypha sp. PMI_526]|nr:hypothetical protein DL96DRAFT_1819944 [Flagelloscypha sp. PMI_526]